MTRPTRVALALGGGGARGYAHIGVIQVLEERGYEIVGIAGTSMGAVIGGLHAAGKLDAYTDWVSALTQRDVIRLLDPTFKGPGAIRAEKILARVTELLGGVTIEDLPIPFTAIATDLTAGTEVWFQHGPVDVAIRASMALPPFITPVMLNGRLLADGGLLNPIPVSATRAAAADLTIAVSLAEVPGSPVGKPTEETAAPVASVEERSEHSRRSLAQLLDGELTSTVTNWFTHGPGGARVDADDLTQEEPSASGPFGELPPGIRTLDVMRLSVETLQRVVTRYRLAGYPPDLMISISRSSCRTLDFHRAGEMIALGRERTIAALDRHLPAAHVERR